MLVNGVGHLAGSAYFQRWLPGATTAPLLVVTSLLLLRAVSRERPVEGRTAAPQGRRKEQVMRPRKVY